MTETSKSAAFPKGWLNKFMMVFLYTPGLQRWLGSSVALLTFRGRKTDRTYTTPVSYSREGDTVTMLSRKSRRWWRNLAVNPYVDLRLAGRTYCGTAKVSIGGDSELDVLLTYLEKRRMDAKAYGVSVGPDGKPSALDTRNLLPRIVIIRVEVKGAR